MNATDTDIIPLRWQVDGLALQAILHRPAGESFPLVIGCHGLMADKSSPKQIALAEACTRQGIGFLRLDHRGCGESQGRLERDTSLEARGRDVVSALAAVGARFSLTTVGLFGSSFGGAVSLSVFRRTNARALVIFAAPYGHAPLQEVHFESRQSWWSRLCFDLRVEIPEVHHLLVVHGDRDTVIPVDHGRHIYRAAAHPKSLLIQEGGDHRMSDSAHQARFTQAAVDWFSAYL